MITEIVIVVTIIAFISICCIIYSCVRLGSKSDALAVGAPINRNLHGFNRAMVGANILGVDVPCYLEYTSIRADHETLVLEGVRIEMPHGIAKDQIEIKLKSYLNENFV